MVTQAEKEAIALEYDSEPRWVEWALSEYRWHRKAMLHAKKYAFLNYKTKFDLAIAARRAYWSARKAAGL